MQKQETELKENINYTIPMLDGRKLVVTRSTDAKHPGVSVVLIDKNGNSHDVALVEENEHRNHPMIHVLVWGDMHNEEYTDEFAYEHEHIEYADGELGDE